MIPRGGGPRARPVRLTTLRRSGQVAVCASKGIAVLTLWRLGAPLQHGAQAFQTPMRRSVTVGPKRASHCRTLSKTVVGARDPYLPGRPVVMLCAI
jgi:hypothetical protein